eukprot:TRINITY_DN7393_c0_g2_i4.p1 TRINITY_DN7393_c0_g2~~TRINITY_DN7393_c0_g2_i4.p1  ORF type:complete len:495 (+),score=36.39 TRINITY_DN7393_c0_g2_i4:35-1519(+)
MIKSENSVEVIGQRKEKVAEQATTLFRRSKVRSLSRGEDIIKDLNSVFLPNVGLVRAECGIIQPIQSFFIRQSSHIKRRSYTRRMLDIISVHKKVNEEADFFLPATRNLLEAELYRRLVRDVSNMLIQRGLNPLYEAGVTIHKDLELNMWLSNLSLRNRRDAISRTDSNISENNSQDILESLLMNDPKVGKWVQCMQKNLERISLAPKSLLPPKKFQTRRRRSNELSLLRTLNQVLDTTGLHCLTRLLNDGRRSLLEMKHSEKISIDLKWESFDDFSRFVCTTSTKNSSYPRYVLDALHSSNPQNEEYLAVRPLLRRSSKSLYSFQNQPYKSPPKIDTTDEELRILAEDLSMMSNLQYLKLDFCIMDFITDSGMTSIAKAIGSLPKLLSLSLTIKECGRLSSVFVKDLAAVLQSNSTLKELLLNILQNLGNDKCAIILSEILPTLSSLERLTIDLDYHESRRISKQISDVGACNIIEAVGSMNDLSYLSLVFSK